MKKYLLVILVLLGVNIAWSQVQFHSLQSNPYLQINKKQKKDRYDYFSDTLSLPFFDDFSYDKVYPSSKLWMDKNVYVNNNFAKNPPTVGVATFDVLDENGRLYTDANDFSSVADYLTSKPIDLNAKSYEENRRTYTTDSLLYKSGDDYWVSDSLYYKDTDVYKNCKTSSITYSAGGSIYIHPTDTTFEEITKDLYYYQPELSDTVNIKKWFVLKKYVLSDSLVFSFYYQPQGLGWDSPNKKDSLILQFRTGLLDWRTVFSVTGTALQDFKQVLIPIKNQDYLVQDFQFRFLNYASIASSETQEDAITNDFWNIDYVFLDTGRSVTETTHKDVAFYEANASLFEDYFAIPWFHYNRNSLSLAKLDYKLRNLDKEQHSVPLNYRLINENTGALLEDTMFGNTPNIAASSDMDLEYTQSQINSNIAIPVSLSDSTVLAVSRFIWIKPPYASFSNNDTVTYHQKFYNYYAYDDGSAEVGLSLIGNEAQFAFLINSLKADSLRALQMFFNSFKDYGTADIPAFSLCVWENDGGKPGELLYQEDNFTPIYERGMNQFHIYKFKEAVFVEKSFFVGWINETYKVYSLGYDFNHDNKNQVFYNLNGDWESLSRGVPMIRPVLGEDFVMPVSISEKTVQNNTLEIFPNPNSGFIRFKVNTEIENFPVRIYSEDGKLLFNRTVNNGSQVDITFLNKGIYFVRVVLEDEIINKKIIKW